MAITAPHYRLLKEHAHLIPRGGSLLEIGEANWYGDCEPDFPVEYPTIGIVAGDNRQRDLHAIAKACYKHLFAPAQVHSIDCDGTDKALACDLNQPVSKYEPLVDERYDLCINHGTAEHIFNVAQVFRTMHDWTKSGGLMIHDAPFTGWIDHGFYNFNPTLFYDLAAANAYQIVSASITHIETNSIQRLENRDHLAVLAREGKIPFNAMLFVVLRKMVEQPFKIPWQGVYARTLSPAGQRAWRELR